MKMASLFTFNTASGIQELYTALNHHALTSLCALMAQLSLKVPPKYGLKIARPTAYGIAIKASKVQIPTPF